MLLGGGTGSKGGPDDCFYVIVSGRVRVYSSGKSTSSSGGGGRKRRWRIIADLGRGQQVGASALISGSGKTLRGGRGPETQRAVCTRDTEVVVITRQSFKAICAATPTVMFNFTRSVLLRELRESALLPRSALPSLSHGLPSSHSPEQPPPRQSSRRSQKSTRQQRNRLGLKTICTFSLCHRQSPSVSLCLFLSIVWSLSQSRNDHRHPAGISWRRACCPTVSLRR